MKKKIFDLKADGQQNTHGPHTDHHEGTIRGKELIVPHQPHQCQFFGVSSSSSSSLRSGFLHVHLAEPLMLPAAFFSIHDSGRAASPSVRRSFHSSAAALLPPSPHLGHLASAAVAARQE